jgi:alpha-tubulin suppressor-like RCC1 family protein
MQWPTRADLWAWGHENLSLNYSIPLGEQASCPVPKPIESLRGIKVDAVASGLITTALADDGSVYTWGCFEAAREGALGLGDSVTEAGVDVRKPQRIPALRVACGL